MAQTRRPSAGAVALAALTCCGLLAPWMEAGVAAQAARREEPCPWGADVNRGSGEKLVDSVRGELRGFCDLSPSARPKRARELVASRAVAAIEGWKRWRNPELIELARACLDHPDWRVVHRALFWMERLRDPALPERALGLLGHSETRLRERAVLALIASWRAGDPAPIAVAQRLAAETDFHVQQALAALQRRIGGTLVPREIAPELVVDTKSRMRVAPFLDRLKSLEEVAPGATVPEFDEPDLARYAASASLPTVTRWVAPLLEYGVEEVPRLQLQPFGKPRREGQLAHTGQDVGGCMDGAGIYAIGEGIVRSISGGHDAGTRIVVEHLDGDGTAANAVYMHAATTLFVAAGEVVAPGQLLATIGLSWSAENGGQFAHLHFGLYPGPFNPSHNYGYKPADQGLDDWFDPAEWLRAHVPELRLPRSEPARKEAEEKERR